MSSCKVDNQGRIVIPAKWRERQGVRAGTELVLLEEDGLLIIQTREQAVREAQAIVARAIPSKRSLVKELQAERKFQSGRETRLRKS